MKNNNNGRLRRFFCSHKNADWYSKKELFSNLSGDTVYKVCKDCGKQIDEKFIRHD